MLILFLPNPKNAPKTVEAHDFSATPNKVQIYTPLKIRGTVSFSVNIDGIITFSINHVIHDKMKGKSTLKYISIIIVKLSE